MSKKEQLCQQELETYGSFHHILEHAASHAHNPQTANYVQTKGFKNTFDSLMVKMMKAENGDELEANYKNFTALLDKEKDNGHISAEIHAALIEPANQLKSQRAPYLSKPLEKQKNWKKNAWIVTGTTVIATALALTIVAAPLIPAAVLGGAALAYGIADQANELSEHIAEASNEELAGMHHHNFDDFKQKLDSGEIDKDHKLNIKAYTEPKEEAHKEPPQKKEGLFKQGLKAIGKATGVTTLFSKESTTREKLKAAGKMLGIAGLALAVVAMAAVFPPVGIPVAAGLAIGIASTAVIAGAGAVVVFKQNEAKKEHKALIEEHQSIHEDLSKSLEHTFSESAKQTETNLKNEESTPVTHKYVEPNRAPMNSPKEVAKNELTRPPLPLKVTAPEPSPISPRGVADLENVKADIEHYQKDPSHFTGDTETIFEEINDTLIKSPDISDIVRPPVSHVSDSPAQKPPVDINEDDDSEGESSHP